MTVWAAFREGMRPIPLFGGAFGEIATSPFRDAVGVGNPPDAFGGGCVTTEILPIGLLTSIGAGLADRLVPAESVGRATAVIFSAVPLGSVLGVPVGTFIGDVAGWRTAFAVMGVLAVGVWIMMLLVIPALPPTRVTRLRVLRTALESVTTRFALLTTFLIVLAHFGAYTYVTPFLEQVSHAGSGLVTVILLTYGAAGIVGNFVGGATVARHPHATFAAAAGTPACATGLLPVLGRWPIGVLALLVVWGVAYGAVPVCSQAWFSKACPAAPEAVAA
ncbi:MFS transporter [Streptomyces sp. XD-27]|uniref:MFS transporter n=1 Tax=Streptomyces sp. XD-27 TaxID=3062779 RepID=UPI00350E4977